MRQIHHPSWLRSSPPLLLFAVLIVLASQAAWAQPIALRLPARSGHVGGGCPDVEVTATNTGTKVPCQDRLQPGRESMSSPIFFPGQYSVEFKKDGSKLAPPDRHARVGPR